MYNIYNIRDVREKIINTASDAYIAIIITNNSTYLYTYAFIIKCKLQYKTYCTYPQWAKEVYFIYDIIMHLRI